MTNSTQVAHRASQPLALCVTSVLTILLSGAAGAERAQIRAQGLTRRACRPQRSS